MLHVVATKVFCLGETDQRILAILKGVMLTSLEKVHLWIILRCHSGMFSAHKLNMVPEVMPGSKGLGTGGACRDGSYYWSSDAS